MSAQGSLSVAPTPEATTSTNPSLRARIIVVATSVVLSLLIGEVAVRVFRLSQTMTYKRVNSAMAIPNNSLTSAEGQKYLDAHNRGLGFKNPYVLELRPNASVVWDGLAMRTNELGYRSDVPYPRARDSARRRIIVVGDSVTFGYQVPVDKIFTTVLAERLSQTRPTEVFNFGLGGSDTKSNLYHFRRAMTEFAPDLIVYQFGLNDVVVATSVAPVGAIEASGVKSLLRKSALYLFLAERYNYLRLRRSRSTTESNGWATGIDKASDELTLHATELNKTFGEAQQRGIKVLFVFFPYDYQILSADVRVLRPSQQLQGLLNPQAASYLDLTPIFRAAKNPAGLLLDDAHLAVEGHRLASEALAPRIEELLKSPQRP